jgi:hypothetical protein
LALKGLGTRGPNFAILLIIVRGPKPGLLINTFLWTKVEHPD